MKKKILVLILGLLLIAVNLYAAGDLIVEGNVGVGTTTPATTLDVKGTITLEDNETIENSADQVIFRSSVNSNRRFVIDLSNIWRAGLYGYGDDGISRLFFGSPVQIGNNVVLIFGNSTPAGIAWSTAQGTGKHYMRFGTELGGTNNASGYFMFTEEYDNPTISAAVANPTIRLASADHTKYIDFWHDQTNANINWNTGSLILPRGNVGIGTTTPSYKLDVAGVVNASGGYTQVSDVKFKKDITAIESPLNKILNIKGVTYSWKTDEYKEKGFSEGTHYGVIGQEIEKVLPDVVKESPNGEKNVSYTEIIPVLIEAVKEQQRTIEELKAELRQLKAKDLIAKSQ